MNNYSELTAALWSWLNNTTSVNCVFMTINFRKQWQLFFQFFSPQRGGMFWVRQFAVEAGAEQDQLQINTSFLFRPPPQSVQLLQRQMRIVVRIVKSLHRLWILLALPHTSVESKFCMWPQVCFTELISSCPKQVYLCCVELDISQQKQAIRINRQLLWRKVSVAMGTISVRNHISV